MFISVVPLVRTIRGVEVFTYTSEELVVVGQLVMVPWRTQHVVGVVQAIKVAGLAKAKPIVAVLPTVLPEAYHELLQWFANYYRISLPAAYHAALPMFAKRGKPVSLQRQSTPLPVTVSKKRLPLITKLVGLLRRPTKPVTVLYQSEAEAIAITKGLAADRVVVVLTGEDQQAKQWAEQLQGYWITTSSPRTIRFAFEQLLHRQPGIYVGTKRLSLLPITEADVVVVINPEFSSHKQWDQNPRYHTLRVAQLAARRLVCFSEAPRLEQFANHLIKKELLPGELPTKLVQVAPEPAQPLASTILDRLQTAYCAVIWHNRKGVYRYLQCNNCAHVMTAEALRCARCSSSDLRQRGFGTTYLMKQLQQSLPNHRIVEVTADQAGIIPECTEPTIYVGTTALFNRIHWPSVQLAIVTSLDAQLAIPDFRAPEHALQQLVHLRNRVPLLIVQSQVEQHELVQAAQKPWPIQWYTRTLAERTQFNYPPAGDYLVAIHSQSRQERVFRQVSQLPKEPNWLIDRER